MRKVILFANWRLGAIVLEKLLKENFKIYCVVTQFDENTKDPYYNIVFNLAKINNLNVYTSLKDFLLNEIEKIEKENFIGISVAFNKKIPKQILDKMDIINVHPSIIPEYRGGSPIIWQIKNKEKFTGYTFHFMTDEFDYGEIIFQDKLKIEYRMKFSDFTDILYEKISSNLVKILKDLKEKKYYKKPSRRGKIYPKIPFPQILWDKSIKFISEFYNRKRIAIFTGNRAEFGILFPLIVYLSNFYIVDLYVSGTHLDKRWNSIDNIRSQLKNLPVGIIELKLREGISYKETLGDLYNIALKKLEKIHKEHNYEFSIVLGDRIETFAFALASFYSNIPIIHIGAGDIANVPYYDTNVRHSISKIAHVFFTNNEESSKILKQLGEEEWRIFNIGHLSLSYLKLLSQRKEEELVNALKEEFNLTEDTLVIFLTYHPSHFKDEEQNFKDFEEVLKGIFMGIKEVKKKRKINIHVIISYPNNDPGFSKIFTYIKQQELKNEKKFTVVPELGTLRILVLFKNFKVIVAGNSSLGLTETAFFGIPTLNIGDRQKDRFRGKNVFDVEINADKIKNILKWIVNNYDKLREKFTKDKTSKHFFGTPEAVEKAVAIINKLSKMPKEKLLFKRFVIRNVD